MSDRGREEEGALKFEIGKLAGLRELGLETCCWLELFLVLCGLAAGLRSPGKGERVGG